MEESIPERICPLQDIHVMFSEALIQFFPLNDNHIPEIFEKQESTDILYGYASGETR